MTSQSTVQARSVEFHDAGEGVFWITVADTAGGNMLMRPLIGELLRTLQTVREAQALKVVVLKGLPNHFLQGGRESIDAAVELKLFQALAKFPCPVVAAMQGSATGAGLMVAALCDFMVCSREGRHGFTSEAAMVVPADEEERLLVHRFGALQADRLLAGMTTAHRWNCPVVAADEVELHAQRLAASLAAKSQRSLRLLKQHLVRPMLEASQALKTVAPVNLQPVLAGAALAIDLSDGQVEVRSQGHALLVNLRVGSDASALLQCLRRIGEARTEARVIVVSSDHAQFIAGLDAGTALQLQQAVVDAALPVVAVLGASASGLAWLVAQACDQVLYQRDGRYSAAGLLQEAQVSNAACTLFTRRFGLQLGKELLLGGGEYSGEELQQRAGVPLTGEFDVTQAWAWPVQAVRAWKQRRSLALREQIAAGDWPACESVDLLQEEDPAQPISLNTPVIHATAHANGIVSVRMEDREQKNLFSPEFIAGMNEAFERIAQRSDTKVVILTGFDKYFASGGTREALLAIQEGKAKFTDDNTYLRAFHCPVPVIAALQGHAVGGGLSLGLFADFVLLSEESQYVSPYMNYGFTPGAGATLIVPEKLGNDLGRHSLLTGQESSGSELKARGVALPVVPRKDIEHAAFELAQRLARHTREGLMAFKRRFNRGIEQRLAENTQQELAMHGQTFVGQESTLRQIESSFTAKAEEAAPVARTEVTSSGDTPAQITATLKTLLARELHMNEADIDEDTQFIDLGLDSITGVTWIRKTNLHYDLSLEATTVYSHPTLTKLGRHVHQEVGRRAPAVPVVQPVVRQAQSQPLPVPRDADAHELTAELKRMLARELHLGENELDEDTQFIDLGLDSITGVTWVRKINEKYGTAFEATVVYSHPTLNKFGRHLKDVAVKRAPAASIAPITLATPVVPKVPELAVQEPVARDLVSWRKGRRPAVPPAPSSARGGLRPSTAPRTQAIAVIGMAGQFPGARTLDEYWQNIAQGKNCIQEIPPERWNVDAYYQPGEPAAGKTNSRWMGLLDDVDLFDPMFFNILPAEARSMDPQQRLFLQACWQGIENAGYDAKSLSGGRCGVFVGTAAGDYGFLSEKVQLSAHGFTGGASSILAARISYFLNLQGPCLAIDTACSSSLVAIASACDSLVSGSSDLALAGGVYVGVGPAMHIMTSQAGMLSADGKCYSFDRRANGFVPGEGVGVVLLKRLEDAERDGDIIHGVIQGWGVNQDGRTNGITAPNPDSQARLQQQVYERHGIDPSGIQLIEAHGTGTVLGDPIEVEGLKKSFARYTTDKGFCAIGSVKSNIGHCLLAAGISGFIKLLLALRHKQLPPTINFERLNEHIRLEDSPFYVNTRLQDWTPGDAGRQAAISSFGYSGTNAHVVVGEHRPMDEARTAVSAMPGAGTIVPLSARTANQLRQRCRDLLDFVRGEGRSADLNELAYTLQVGREAMDERLVLIAGSLGDLARKLQEVVNGEQGVPGMHRGQVRSSKEGVSIISQDEELKTLIVDKWIAEGQTAKLAGLWAKGVEIDWRKLYGDVTPRRMVLPGYPFAKERYWIDDEDIDGGRIVNAWRGAQAAVASKEPGAAQPLREPNEEWLLSEQWVPLALETAPGSWRERVRARSGDDILVVSAEREIFSAIDQLCRSAEEILDHEGEMWRVEHAPIEVHADGRVRNFDLARHLRHGSTRLAIFLFLPTQMAQSAPAEELDIAFECVQRLSTHAAGRPVQFYCCHQDGGGEASVYQDSLPGLFRSAMLQHPTHRYRSIGVASEPGAADTLPLRAMREWLCDNTTEWPPADVPMVRYMGGRRLELRGSASSSTRTAAMAAEAMLNARIAAFERGEISTDEFGECLRGLEIDSLSEGLQQRIVQAIERVERMVALPASGDSPLQRILASVETVLGLKADAIDLDRPLQEYGMDSITTVRLTAALEKEFGITVPPRALLEHPSLNALAAKVGRDLGQMQLVS